MALDVRRIVSGHPYFAALPKRQRASAVSSARTHRFKAGEHVWNIGQRVDSYCLVAEGLLTTSLELESGKSAILEIFRPGEVCGCLIQLLSGVAVCDLRAVTDAALVCIPAKAIHAGGPERHGWYGAMARGLAFRFHRLFKLRALSGVTSGRRLPSILFWLDAAKGGSIPMTQRALAMIAGLSEETVCRALAPLKRKGVIRISRGRVAIVDRDALKRHCEDI